MPVITENSTKRVSGAITETTTKRTATPDDVNATKRVSGAITETSTKRVAGSGLDAIYDAWGGSWASTWGESWYVHLSAPEIGHTLRVTGTITETTTKRV